jgi:hypothetical protein
VIEMALTAAERKRMRAAVEERGEDSHKKRMSRMDELDQFYNVNEGSSRSKGGGVVHGIKKILGLKTKPGMQHRRSYKAGTSLNPDTPSKSRKKGGLRKI